MEDYQQNLYVYNCTCGDPQSILQLKVMCKLYSNCILCLKIPIFPFLHNKRIYSGIKVVNVTYSENINIGIADIITELYIEIY